MTTTDIARQAAHAAAEHWELYTTHDIEPRSLMDYVADAVVEALRGASGMNQPNWDHVRALEAQVAQALRTSAPARGNQSATDKG